VSLAGTVSGDAGGGQRGEALVVARNVSMRCLAIVTEMIVGVCILPLNVSRLGAAAYGLWMLTASITAYFSILDLGYGGALTKFVAQYRARRDPTALNEILSTIFHVFAAFGSLAYAIAIVMAVFLDRVFHLGPDQAHVGRIVLLVTMLNVSAGFAFSVFGGVINGFQRYDLNSAVSIVTTIVTAIVNVAVLLAGYGLVALVCATTIVRLAAYWVYRGNAYRVFPQLHLSPRLFRRERLRELTSFSVYMLLIDWARKLNYALDTVVIAMFMTTTAVAIWSVGQRVVEAEVRLTIQLSDVLFPAVVDHDVSRRADRLVAILLVGTRLSLATVLPISTALLLLARPLVLAWVGPAFSGSVAVLQLLAIVVIFRVGNATAATLLKGAGGHRFVAIVNIATGIVNVVLSVLLVRPLGLVGVALGTLVPVAISGAFIVFPAGCRRVGVPLGAAVRQAVWPAVWPAFVMAAYIALTAPVASTSLVGVAAQLLLAIGVYASVFLLVAVEPDERRLYVARALALTGGWRVRLRALTEGA
jgi:O-antigen/teichoic acid export membrane protein